MRSFRKKRFSSIYFVLALLTAASGAGYAMETMDVDRADSYGVISEEQQPAFLAYAKRQNMKRSSSIDRVSVGDTRPDFGITYYVLPLSYGRARSIDTPQSERTP